MAKEKGIKKKMSLDETLKYLNKEHGRGAVLKYSDREPLDIEVVSSGSLGVDVALGVAGYPKGRIIEIYGPFASGKTTLTLHAVAEVQKQGGLAAFIDVEHALDPSYATALGVNMDDVLISQPKSGEEALEIAEKLTSSGEVDIVVVDSVAALVPQAEIDGEMGASHMGLQARLLGQACRKMASVVSETGTILIFINQLREKIGVMFGSPETTTGGKALPFYSSVRLDIRRISSIKDGDNIVGNRTRVKVVKNKVSPPFKSAEFDIIFGEGISLAGEVLDSAVSLDIVDKAGAWYSYDGARIGQGRSNTIEYLKEHPELLETVEKHVRQAYGLL